jgi:hypothetical protein
MQALQPRRTITIHHARPQRRPIIQRIRNSLPDEQLFPRRFGLVAFPVVEPFMAGLYMSAAHVLFSVVHIPAVGAYMLWDTHKISSGLLKV